MSSIQPTRQIAEPVACGSPLRTAVQLQEFVKAHGIKLKNVAGSRESKEPGIYDWMMEVLEDAFFRSGNHPGIFGGPGEG